MKRSIVVATAILAILGIAVSIEHFFDSDHYNSGFYEHPSRQPASSCARCPLPDARHGSVPRPHTAPVAGASPSGGTHRRVCRRRKRGHSTADRCVVSFSGPAAMMVVGPFAGLFVGALSRGLWPARAGRLSEHRECMIRAMAVAVATSIATIRTTFVPTLVPLGDVVRNILKYKSNNPWHN